MKNNEIKYLEELLIDFPTSQIISPQLAFDIVTKRYHFLAFENSNILIPNISKFLEEKEKPTKRDVLFINEYNSTYCKN